MAIITYIDGIPAFSTKLEAMAWGQKRLGIRGAHTHNFQGNTVFMAGIDHSYIKDSVRVENKIIQRPISNKPTRIINGTPVTSTSTGGTTGGGY